MYAKTISAKVNQIGPARIMLTAIPPIRNNPPIENANLILCVAAIKPAANAPTKVPRACAKNGKMKYLNSRVGRIRWASQHFLSSLSPC